jgi:hypothetical protein
LIDDFLANMVTYKTDADVKQTKEIISLHTVREHYGKIIIPAAVKREILRELETLTKR